MIGWDQFFRGKVAIDWNHLQHRYACRHSKVQQSKNWLTWLIRYMSSQFHTLWISRNKDRHGHDSKSQYQLKLEQARREVAALYALRDQVLPQDHELFCASLESHLTQPLSQLHGWLTLNKPLIQMSVRQARAAYLAKTPRLDSFFKRLPPLRSCQPGRHPSSFPQRKCRSLRMTQFATTITRKTSRTISKSHLNASVAIQLSSSSQKSKPRQRYLFDFFPNHP